MSRLELTLKLQSLQGWDCPGLPQVISAVCLLKVILLRWVLVKVVRRQMLHVMERDDEEKKSIRTKLSVTGKVRLGRFFGTYK